MLKDRKLRCEYILGGNCYGYCKISGFDDYIYGPVTDKNILNEMSGEEYYFAEVKTSASESNYHTFSFEYGFEGVFLNFNLNTIDTIKFFGEDLSDELFPKGELIDLVEKLLEEHNVAKKDSFNNPRDVDIVSGCLKVTLPDRKLDDGTLTLCNNIMDLIRNYYSEKDVHITRMFGSYILLKKDKGVLRAIKATPIPIKYCPLMVKLLKEVGGELAENLLNTLSTSDSKKQTKLMCELINQVVIKAGYFDTNRPLNSCEANVLFGASETISSAFRTGMLDAAVIVSNNLGTIITTNESNTQGAVKRMTGLFYTAPSEELVKIADEAGIIPVFPYSGEIDQIEGVKKAINMGAKRIAVTLAAQDNAFLEKIKELDSDDVTIYKFGLCSTGIDEKTALTMLENADIVWSCASKYVKEYIEPSAIAQVGLKIPVHIMTRKGWNLVKNHLDYMSVESNLDDVILNIGNEKPVFVNTDGMIRKLVKKDIEKCNDCPYPCI